MKFVEGKKSPDRNNSSRIHPSDMAPARHAVPSSYLVPLKLPLWARLLLKIPCPHFPSRLKGWEGLFTSIGGLCLVVLVWFFEVWLSSQLIHVPWPLRWLVFLLVPILAFIIWLRVELERFLNYIRIYIKARDQNAC